MTDPAGGNGKLRDHNAQDVETPKVGQGELVPQPNGKGALRRGGTNRGGPGRPDLAVQIRCREGFYQRIPTLERFADGKDGKRRVRVDSRIKAIDTLARYAGIPTRLEVTPGQEPQYDFSVLTKEELETVVALLDRCRLPGEPPA